MSKYEELKQRISKVEGWTKEADDILKEIVPSITSGPYRISIPVWHEDGINDIRIIKTHTLTVDKCFDYSSQCQKNEAFKKALMWLLDQSDIKKDLSGTTQKVTIEGKTYEAEIIREV